MDIIFLGSHGYGVNYGGWETFINNLIDNWKYPNTRFFVFGFAKNKDEQGIEEVNGVVRIKIFTKAKGGLKAVLTDWKSFKFLKKLIKQYNIINPILYVMGARVGILMWLKRHFFKKHKIRLVHNPAGLEWKRDKWNFLTKRYIYANHILLSKASQSLICDSKGMVEVYEKLLHNKKTLYYIPYGTYPIDESSIVKTAEIKELFERNGIKEDEYFLMIGRFVPENNYELILNEFMKSKTNKDLVIVCNNNQENKYFNSLVKRIHFSNDKRIKFIGAIYDKSIVNYLRYHSFGYIHGHSVGGTNPGLLEALSVANIFLIFNVSFNKYIAEDTAFYFDDKIGNLSSLIYRVEKLSKKERIKNGELAHKLMREEYTWGNIVNQYYEVFNKILDSEM